MPCGGWYDSPFSPLHLTCEPSSSCPGDTLRSITRVAIFDFSFNYTSEVVNLHFGASFMEGGAFFSVEVVEVPVCARPLFASGSPFTVTVGVLCGCADCAAGAVCASSLIEGG